VEITANRANPSQATMTTTANPPDHTVSAPSERLADARVPAIARLSITHGDTILRATGPWPFVLSA
jgi:hypothetical protein